MKTLVDEIREYAEDIALKYGQDLIEVELGSNGKNKVIRLIVGSRKGPKVEDLTKINRDFSKKLSSEGKEDLLEKFGLEVSSPGLDRPLKTIKDFDRNLERFVKLTYQDENQKILSKEAQIINCFENEIEFSFKKGKQTEKKIIKLEDIKKAKVAIKF